MNPSELPCHVATLPKYDTAQKLYLCICPGMLGLGWMSLSAVFQVCWSCQELYL